MIKIEDVAKLAKVSTSTVSRALSRPEMVSVSTRERVVNAADRLGYQPNKLARSLRTQQNHLIGLIVTDIMAPFHATLAKGVQDAAEKHGYGVFLFNTDEQPEREARYLRELQSHLPAGLLIVPTGKTKENLKNFVRNLTVVELDRSSGTPGVYSVLVDNIGGARKAVEHLLELGHRRIGMVAGTQTVTTAVERLEGYRQALLAGKVQLQNSLITYGNHKEDGGYKATKKLLSLPKKQRPSALFIGNSEMAAGAMVAVRELGLELPRDLSLISFDDTRWAQLMQPALTVVSQPAYDLGYLACETLISALNRGKDFKATTLRLSTELIVRQTTAPPK